MKFSMNTGVVSLSLLQGIFPTQGLNPGLPHCKWIFYQLSHKGSPRILEWVAFLFSREIFPTQGLNQGLLHCRQILYQPSSGKPNLDKQNYKNPELPQATLHPSTHSGHTQSYQQVGSNSHIFIYKLLRVSDFRPHLQNYQEHL